jgi:DNA-binding NarL/FixJ family response regulator
MIRLLLADDHALVRAGLRQLFAAADGIRVEAEAVDGMQVLEQARRQTLDVVLLDLSMPGVNGPELIGRLRRRHPQLPVLVLSMHDDPLYAQRALKAGATGYLTKDNEPELLVQAVRKVAGGGRFIDAALAQRIALQTIAPAPQQPHDVLTSRELQILRLLVQGASINEIAAKLSISNKTVSSHKANLMRKLAVESNAELVRYGVRHGLVDASA